MAVLEQGVWYPNKEASETLFDVLEQLDQRLNGCKPSIKHRHCDAFA
ncbi:hypothetical protein [Vibrio sp. WZ-1]